MSTAAVDLKPAASLVPSLDEMRAFIEHEADLLDDQRFEEWAALYADDGAYWAPAKHGQQSWLDHVSLFYDEKVTMRTRVLRLNHAMIHCQEPKSRCVRLVSNFRIDDRHGDTGTVRVRSKFIMLEDRPGADRRFFGGRYEHTLRPRDGRLEIVQKRVELTNCDQSFPMLTQPF